MRKHLTLSWTEPIGTVPWWLFYSMLLALPLLLSNRAFANSAGPQPRLTAGFQEGTCIRCHNSHALNEGRSRGGDFRIDGVPRTYTPGKAYKITVLISHPDQSRWGFELSARLTDSGKQAGKWSTADNNSQVKSDADILYVMHTSAGTRKGEKDGPVEFHIQWTAPESAAGSVLFNAAGNAADGGESPEGDYIYTAGGFSRPAVEPQTVTEIVEVGTTAAKNIPRVQETSRVVDLPSPVDLKKGSMEILIQHRFLDSIGDAGAGNAFGIDSGANMNIGLNYALSDRMSVGVARTRFGQIVELSGTYEIRTAKDSMWKLALRGGVEGTKNFHEEYSPSIQLASAFDFNRFRLNVVPTMVFNSRPDAQLEFNRGNAIHPESNHTFALGLGTDIALTRKISLTAEYVPRLAGFGGFYERHDQIAGGLVIRTWGHVFAVTVATSRDFTPANYAVNAQGSDVSLGFNLYRRIR